MSSTMYTVVSERRGSFLNNWMAKVEQYDAYRGHFGYKAVPVTYYTDGGNAFCVIVQSEVRLAGWFETHDKQLVQPALLAINLT